MVSSRTLSEIWVIDHGQGKNGGILYRWGNPQTYRAGTSADQLLYDQHGVHWIAEGLPGAGNLLVFSNGNARNFSTVDEIEPPLDENGTYQRTGGAAFGPARAHWSYGENVRPQFLSRTFGGAQRLPNGNTLICISNANRLVEVPPEGDIVWDADITPSDVAAGGGSFRATRFPVNFDGLRATPLFRPARVLLSTASLTGGATAPGALVTALGDSLGARVEVTDAAGVTRSAPVMVTAPGRLDFLVPPEAAIGPARVRVAEQSADIRTDAVAPALFPATVAVTAGDQLYLLLFGTGLRGGGTYAVTIGGVPVAIYGAAPRSEFAGLDQVNVGPLPSSLAGRGEQTIILKVDEKAANPIKVSVQ